MDSVSNSGPLAGLRVVDFSTLLPGPWASMLLANMGAQVLKIESPTRPDIVRSLPPFVGGRSAADLQLNRGKRSVAIDLKSSPGREIALQLIADADVLLEQFRPGVMKNSVWGTRS
jgi:crotonobetainyl-CoA:carnitine CoA-transferase CaiB-like acyl-CoA transferase